jgi:hypothetical protein
MCWWSVEVGVAEIPVPTGQVAAGVGVISMCPTLIFPSAPLLSRLVRAEHRLQMEISRAAETYMRLGADSAALLAATVL